MWRPPKGYTSEGKPIPPNNWRAAFGGSVWEWDEGTEEFYLHLFAVGQPDFVSRVADRGGGEFEEALMMSPHAGDFFRIGKRKRLERHCMTRP
jgi:oligo-1,6-glucosidase